MMRMRLSVTCLLWVVAVAANGCKVKLNRSHASGAVEASAKPAPMTAPIPVKPVAHPTVAIPPVARPIPAGPSFAVEAGAGLGPIRFGSTVATVERHMQTKCEELTDKYCRYVAAGIELELTQGAVSGIVIHRFDRPIAGDLSRKWGTFAGGIPPAVRMMMVPEAVMEYLGKPKRTEVVTGDNPNWTVRRDTYDGMILEYDK